MVAKLIGCRGSGRPRKNHEGKTAPGLRQAIGGAGCEGEVFAIGGVGEGWATLSNTKLQHAFYLGWLQGLGMPCVYKQINGESYAARGVGKVEPDFYAAEVGAFSANGGSDIGAEVARGPDVPGELRVDFAELGDFVH